MHEELPKAYDPKVTDARWYAFWEKEGFFRADPSSKKPPFSLVIPPPNVTGILHMGHALVGTLQDILSRWKRMCGFEVLWVPGTDHAGIATQTVVERALLAKEGRRRDSYTREQFVDKVWEWKELHEKTILKQLKALGCSCDWSRLRFTMDSGCNTAVNALFKKLFDEGLIYRGDYLVNWDPITQTALADDEVEYEERDSFLWTFKYPLKDHSGHVYIATTRPETMLGDTAIAVSPKDPRYTHLIGKKVLLPIMEREIPIIADHHVDPEFGTGMVKVTPAHDPNDYRMGLDHNLPFVNVMHPDGRINENGGPFKGMAREEARDAVVRHMQGLGLVEKIQRYTLRVGVSYRSKAVIEPYLSKQWFIKMEPFARNLREAVRSGKMRILPKNWENTYFHWVDNLRDWCISRQLWWGHRIPIWHRRDASHQMLCFTGEGPPPDPEEWEQDPDVLDTWFSSALWPLSTLGWPETTPEFEKFYPVSVLVTGHDILFFWVARMMAMGAYASGHLPFPETFLHGLIYGKSYWRTGSDGTISYVSGEEKKLYDLGKPTPPDVASKWEKLSKSKGNVIDPADLIAEYGTDAVRMSLCASANQSPQIDLDRRRFEEFKNFANKVWNGARFVFMNLEGLTSEALGSELDETLLGVEDRWILSALNRVNRQVNEALERYSFDVAALAAYDFFWKEFCAYYVEITKPVLFGKAGTAQERTNKQKILVHVLCNAVRLLHPMAPFITEELFSQLKTRFTNVSCKEKSDPYTEATAAALAARGCAVAPFPKVLKESDLQPEIETTFARLEQIVYTIRNIRAEMQIPPSVAIDIYLVGRDEELKESLAVIKALVRTEKIELVQAAPKLPFAATGAVGDLQIVVPVPKDLATRERARLEKEREKLEKGAQGLRDQLGNAEFLEKAHPDFVQKRRELLQQTEHELTSIAKKLDGET